MLRIVSEAQLVADELSDIPQHKGYCEFVVCIHAVCVVSVGHVESDAIPPVTQTQFTVTEIVQTEVIVRSEAHGPFLAQGDLKGCNERVPDSFFTVCEGTNVRYGAVIGESCSNPSLVQCVQGRIVADVEVQAEPVERQFKERNQWGCFRSPGRLKRIVVSIVGKIPCRVDAPGRGTITPVQRCLDSGGQGEAIRKDIVI